MQIIKTKLANRKFYGQDYCKTNPTSKHHGFDEGKFTPASLFYMPCESAFGDTFFNEYIGERRRVLNPYSEIKYNSDADQSGFEQKSFLPKLETHSQTATAFVPTSLPTLARIRQKYTKVYNDAVQTSIDAAVDKCVAVGPGDGHNALFKLGVRLKNLGLDRFDTDYYLHKAASQMRTPKERHKEVNQIIKKLL